MPSLGVGGAPLINLAGSAAQLKQIGQSFDMFATCLFSLVCSELIWGLPRESPCDTFAILVGAGTILGSTFSNVHGHAAKRFAKPTCGDCGLDCTLSARGLARGCIGWGTFMATRLVGG